MTVGAVDLFCGIGGLTYGIQAAGVDVVAGIDIDKSCKYAYECNNNALFIHKDISEVTGKEIKRLLHGFSTKILVGCAPCQPFSNHRKDKKDRSSHRDWRLLYQFSRIIEESKPHIISMENVPALVNEQVFTDYVACLQKLNYNVTYSIINAADYGIAQSRKRLILLASKWGKIELVPPTHLSEFNTVRNVIGDLPKVPAGGTCPTDRLHQASTLSIINLSRIRASKPNGSWRDWPKDLLLNCHKKETGSTYKSVYGRMAWDELAPTMTTQFYSYGTGRFGHPVQDRALTLREGALLQTFPEGYLFVDDNDPIYFKVIAKHIGNAVPPRLGEIIVQSILRSIPRNRM